MLLQLVTFQTVNFSFSLILKGEHSEEEVKTILKGKIAGHKKDYHGADINEMRRWIDGGDFNTQVIEPGKLYRYGTEKPIS